ASSISFVSMKNAEIAEAHSFGALSGSVDAAGQAEVEIALASVATGIDIRDERMRELLFNVAATPVATVTAEVPLATLETLAIGARETMTLPVTVAANGETARYDALVHVTRIGEGRVSVSSAAPILVEAWEFGYQDGIARLQEIAGLDSIQLAVPVGFDLVFAK
ncbi:MAG: YceI family protein, partial [Pseudomonadota bacterium]